MSLKKNFPKITQHFQIVSSTRHKLETAVAQATFTLKCQKRELEIKERQQKIQNVIENDRLRRLASSQKPLDGDTRTDEEIVGDDIALVTADINEQIFIPRKRKKEWNHRPSYWEQIAEYAHQHGVQTAFRDWAEVH